MLEAARRAERPPSDAHGYSPRTDANCKSEKRRSPEQDRWNQRARREFARLERGMAGHACWSLVLTRGHCMNLDLRCIAWHRLLTHRHQRWPAMQAWTMYEYGPRSGVHLHAVIYGVPGISPSGCSTSWDCWVTAPRHIWARWGAIGNSTCAT